MPRGRPKGSKNKPKNELKNENILPQIEEDVKPVSVVPEVTNEPSEPEKVNKEDEGNRENKEEVTPKPTKQTKQSKEIKEANETKASKPSKSKPQKDYPTCDLCGAECMCDRIKLNLTYLTGKATWHREVKQDLFYLCHDCGREMNKMIDDWLLEHGAERKFQSLEDVSSPVENPVDNVDNMDNVNSAGDTDNSDFEF